jgi:hypothetical protein
MEVHNRQNEENVFIDRIENAIRKATSLATPDIVLNDSPSVRMVKNGVYG